MQTFNVTKKNGVVLTESLTVSLDPEKIVSTRADGDDCEIVYAMSADRRIKPDVMTVTNTKATVDAAVTGAQLDLQVYNLVTGLYPVTSIQAKFVDKITEDYAMVAGTSTSVRKVVYWEGSFLSKTVYVRNSLASLSTAIVTTTTTTT